MFFLRRCCCCCCCCCGGGDRPRHACLLPVSLCVYVRDVWDVRLP
jgi:hypothetical protein